MTDWTALLRSAFAQFAAEPWRQRLMELAGSDRAKSRTKLANQLSGHLWLDPAQATELTHDQSTAVWVEAELRRRGAGSRCWLVVGRRESDLGEALAGAVGSAYGELVLSGTMDRPVGYLETESTARFILG